MEKLKAQWQALPQWQKYVILIFLPTAIIAYIYLMLLTPLREEIKKSRNERDQLISQIEELKRLVSPQALNPLIKQREELQAQLLQKRQELESVVGEIPSQKDVGTVYRRLGLIAKKNGVVILSATLGKPIEIGYDMEKVEGGKGVVKIVRDQGQTQQQQPGNKPSPQQAATSSVVKHLTAELKLSFAGSYSQIVDFLGDLGKEGFVSYPYSLRVSKFEKDKLRGEITLFVLMKEEDL